MGDFKLLEAWTEEPAFPFFSPPYFHVLIDLVVRDRECNIVDSLVVGKGSAVSFIICG